MCNRLILLPETVGNLKHLEELTLWGNCLVRLPSSITSLDRLKVLSLDRNPELRLSRAQEVWVMTLLRNGAEVSLDTPAEISMTAAYDDFEKLYRSQAEKVF